MPRKLLPFLLTTALGLTLSGAAAARRPPSLVRIQAAAASVLDQCPKDTGGGYHDMLTRVDAAGFFQGVPRIVTLVPPRPLPDQVVLTCVGERVQTGGGYRDILMRFEPKESGSINMTAKR